MGESLSEAKPIAFTVTRYRPDVEDRPSSQTYQVPCQEGWVILDALKFIKEHLDSTLTFRSSCGMGICGSCAITVNGEPKLACSAFVHDFSHKNIRLEPLANFPVIKDLVIDMSDFVDKLKSIKPWVVRKQPDETPVGEYLQTPWQLAGFKQFSMCVNCMICYAACPAYAHNHNFIGPAALALAHRYNMDSRDEGNLSRGILTAGDIGVWNCTFIGECSKACPKKVDPAAAIHRLKMAAAKRFFKSLLFSWARR